ncbi:MAG: hypothetical protein WAZ14_03160 [Patescibacteria group bacterium]
MDKSEVEFYLILAALVVVLSIALAALYFNASKENISVIVGEYDNGKISFLKIETAKQIVAKNIDKPQSRIHYCQIIFDNGLIILGLYQEGNTIKASLKAIIAKAFDKDTEIKLFVDDQHGVQRSGKDYFIDDMASIGISDDGETSRIIFGPTPIRKLLDDALKVG